MKKGGLTVTNNKDRNDKVFDIILEEAFDKYAKDVAENEEEYEMSEEEICIMDRQKDAIYKNIMKEIDKSKKKKFPLKLIIPLAAALILVMAYSFNVFAFRTFLHQTYMNLTGTDLNVKTQKLMFEDYNTITNFEFKDEIIIPNWLPEGMQLSKITEETDVCNFFFDKEDIWLTININEITDGNTTKIQTENNDYETKKVKVLDMDCNIVEIKSETGLKTYMAYWNSDNVSYSIMTNIQEDDFNKIIKKLQYLED